MRAIRRSLVVILVLGVTAVGAASQTRRTSQQYARQVILQLETHTDTFRNGLNAALNRNAVGNTSQEENISIFVANFADAIKRLHDRQNRREASAADAQEVLNNAGAIDRFLRRHPLDTRTQRYWTTVRTDLNHLASIYSVSWPTTGREYSGERNYPPDRNYPTGPGYSNASLNGTYRLDPSRSDDANQAASRALRSLPYSEQQRMREQLMRRLEAPDQIAIDIRGRSVTLASTRAPQITFEADGREHTETTSSGRTIQSVATLSGNQLSVKATGESDNQFEVTFSPIDNGRALSVVRRVFVSGLNNAVDMRSTYQKNSDVALFSIYTGAPNYPVDETRDGWIVQNGDRVVAELNTPLSTNSARDGERFTAMVRLPTQYAGATIEGHVTDVQRGGRITGRSQMTLNFDRIRLRDGRSYRFAGIVQTVRMPNGDTVSIDNEGAIQEDSQTNKTVQRTAIGTAVGAIIGAIAGGGKGAAIGAVIGAGGGAGSVYIQGRDDLDLPQGTEIVIQTTGPNR